MTLEELPEYDVSTIPFRARPLETTRSRVQRAKEARKGVRKAGAAVRGHVTGSCVNPVSGLIHMPASMIAQLSQGENLSHGIRENCVRYQKIAGRGRRNILFIIDTSGSMLSDHRFAKVKGCVISLLESSYAKRVRVGIISFGGLKARLALPFTTSAELAASQIDSLKGGGTTPLIEALGIAGNLIADMREEDLSIYLLSDGRYNRTVSGREDWQIRAFGDFCKTREIPVTLIDAGSGKKTSKSRSERMAAMLHAAYQPLEELRLESFESDSVSF